MPGERLLPLSAAPSVDEALAMVAAARERREAADRAAARALDELRMTMRIAKIAGARTGQIAGQAGMCRQRALRVVGHIEVAA